MLNELDEVSCHLSCNLYILVPNRIVTIANYILKKFLLIKKNKENLSGETVKHYLKHEDHHDKTTRFPGAIFRHERSKVSEITAQFELELVSS